MHWAATPEGILVVPAIAGSAAAIAINADLVQEDVQPAVIARVGVVGSPS
jgi:hypothetical protein